MGVSNEEIIFSLQYNLETINELAEALISSLKGEKVWLLEGDMGSGKTTLIKQLCTILLVSDNVTSPTYSLVNEYCTTNGQEIYHFDFYRIKAEVEAMDIGCEEYFYSGNYCFIEWPSKIPNLLPESYAVVTISILDDNQRQCNVVLRKN